ncbi:hypothetical protein M9Y10_001419 [Tritrichomonas musculus]|uniref:Uncharacterized protein n=1 Tax=Tritrichomonas musculus TaxID=1915356 RepID=A0ABR2L7V1_9EUKA
MNMFDISEKDILLNFIGELVKRNEIKALRKLLKNNPYYAQFKPKELNNQFNINGYMFTKRNNNIILIVDKKDSVNDKCLGLLNEVLNELICIKSRNKEPND